MSEQDFLSWACFILKVCVGHCQTSYHSEITFRTSSESELKIKVPKNHRSVAYLYCTRALIVFSRPDRGTKQPLTSFVLFDFSILKRPPFQFLNNIMYTCVKM